MKSCHYLLTNSYWFRKMAVKFSIWMSIANFICQKIEFSLAFPTFQRFILQQSSQQTWSGHSPTRVPTSISPWVSIYSCTRWVPWCDVTNEGLSFRQFMNWTINDEHFWPGVATTYCALADTDSMSNHLILSLLNIRYRSFYTVCNYQYSKNPSQWLCNPAPHTEY